MVQAWVAMALTAVAAVWADHPSYTWSPISYQLSQAAVTDFLTKHLQLQEHATDRFLNKALQDPLLGINVPVAHYGITPPACIKSATHGNLDWIHNLIPYEPSAAELSGSNWVVNGAASTLSALSIEDLNFEVINATLVRISLNTHVETSVPVLARPAVMRCSTKDEVVCSEGHCEHVYNTQCVCQVDDRDVCTGNGIVKAVYRVTVPLFVDPNTGYMFLESPEVSLVSSSVSSPCQPKGIRDEVLPEIQKALNDDLTVITTNLNQPLSTFFAEFFSGQVEFLFAEKSYSVENDFLPAPVNFYHFLNRIDIIESPASLVATMNVSVLTEILNHTVTFPEDASFNISDLSPIEFDNCFGDDRALTYSRVCASAAVLDTMVWLADTIGFLRQAQSGILFETNISATVDVSLPVVTIASSSLSIEIEDAEMHITCPRRGQYDVSSPIVDLGFENLGGRGSVQMRPDGGVYSLFYQLSEFEFSKFQLTSVHPSFGLSHQLLTHMAEFSMKKNIGSLNTKLNDLDLPLDPITSSILCNPTVSLKDRFIILESTGSCSALNFLKPSESFRIAVADIQDTCESINVDVYTPQNELNASLNCNLNEKTTLSRFKLKPTTQCEPWDIQTETVLYYEYKCGESVKLFCEDSLCVSCKVSQPLSSVRAGTCDKFIGGYVSLAPLSKCIDSNLKSKNSSLFWTTFDSQSSCADNQNFVRVSEFPVLRKGESLELEGLKITHGGSDFLVYKLADLSNSGDDYNNGTVFNSMGDEFTPIIISLGDCVLINNMWHAISNAPPKEVCALNDDAQKPTGFGSVIFLAVICVLVFLAYNRLQGRFLWIDKSAVLVSRVFILLWQTTVRFMIFLWNALPNRATVLLVLASCYTWIETKLIQFLQLLKWIWSILVSPITESKDHEPLVFFIVFAGCFTLLANVFSLENLLEDPLPEEISKEADFIHYTSVRAFFSSWDHGVQVTSWVLVSLALFASTLRYLPKVRNVDHVYGNDKFWRSFSSLILSLGILFLLGFCAGSLLFFPLSKSSTIDSISGSLLESPDARELLKQVFDQAFALRTVPILLFLLLVNLHGIPFGVMVGVATFLFLREENTLSEKRIRKLKFHTVLPLLALVFCSISLLLACNQILNPEKGSFWLWVLDASFSIGSVILLSVKDARDRTGIRLYVVYSALWTIVHFFVLNSIMSESLYVPTPSFFWISHLISVILSVSISWNTYSSPVDSKNDDEYLRIAGQLDESEEQHSEKPKLNPNSVDSPLLEYEALDSTPKSDRGWLFKLPSQSKKIKNCVCDSWLARQLLQTEEMSDLKSHGFRSWSRRLELLAAILCLVVAISYEWTQVHRSSVDAVVQSFFDDFGVADEAAADKEQISNSPFYIGLVRFAKATWTQLDLWVICCCIILAASLMDFVKKSSLFHWGSRILLTIASIVFISSLFVRSKPNYVRVSHLNNFLPSCEGSFDIVFLKFLESLAGTLFTALEAPRILPLFFLIALTLIRGLRWAASNETIYKVLGEEQLSFLLIEVGVYSAVILVGPLWLIAQAFYWSSASIDSWALGLMLMIIFSTLITSATCWLFKVKVRKSAALCLIVYCISLIGLLVYATQVKVVKFETIVKLLTVDNVAFALGEFFLMGVLLEDRIVFLLKL